MYIARVLPLRDHQYFPCSNVAEYVKASNEIVSIGQSSYANDTSGKLRSLTIEEFIMNKNNALLSIPQAEDTPIVSLTAKSLSLSMKQEQKED